MSDAEKSSYELFDALKAASGGRRSDGLEAIRSVSAAVEGTTSIAKAITMAEHSMTPRRSLMRQLEEALSLRTQLEDSPAAKLMRMFEMPDRESFRRHLDLAPAARAGRELDRMLGNRDALRQHLAQSPAARADHSLEHMFGKFDQHALHNHFEGATGSRQMADLMLRDKVRADVGASLVSRDLFDRTASMAVVLGIAAGRKLALDRDLVRTASFLGETSKYKSILDRIGATESTRTTQALSAIMHPGNRAFDDLTRSLARTVDPFAGTLKAGGQWEASLSSRMASIAADWVRPADFGASMLGFARVARLSDAVHELRPFGEQVAELVTEELGFPAELSETATPDERDAAAVAAGLKSDLIAFPEGAYDQVVVAAGFRFIVPATPVPAALEAGDPYAQFHPTYYALLNHVEQCLRQFVDQKLRAFTGKPWVKQRVGETVRKRWHDRQTEEREAGRAVYDAIQYADFMDLSEVICQNNNWRDVFAPTFVAKDELQVSLRRLHPVRKAIAHGRPLARSDVITLVSEATRIMKAIGVNLLK